MKKVQKQLLFLPVLCLSMAIGGCGKKETDKTDAADMTKTVPNYTLIYQSEQSSEAESANKNAEENTKESTKENVTESESVEETMISQKPGPTEETENPGPAGTETDSEHAFPTPGV